MGNTRSSDFDATNKDSWWPDIESNDVKLQSFDSKSLNASKCSDSNCEKSSSRRQLSEASKEKLYKFKMELDKKHEKRKQIVANKRKEIEDLRNEVEKYKTENELLRKAKAEDSLCDNLTETNNLMTENEELKRLLQEKNILLENSKAIIQKNSKFEEDIISMQEELKSINKEVQKIEKEKQDYIAHVVALRDTISVSKHMLQIRETQLMEVKNKVETIEQSLTGKEMQILSQQLKREYERQLSNIRNLRTLYEERQRIDRKEKDDMMFKLECVTKELEREKIKNSEMEETISSLEEANSQKYDEIKHLESNLGLVKAEARQYKEELTVINQLFSELLLGFNTSQEINIDKLQKHLEEHHDLLQGIVGNDTFPENSYALPKLLLDLLNQVEADKDDEEDNDLEKAKEPAISTIHHRMNSAEEIVENLPKVWRVLIELLSHQMAPINNLTEDSEAENPCYKTVQTPKGPSVVVSVSQTYIRLKNLILEKKSLEKETSHLKQLNCHLDNRLQDQEKRLGLVQSELSKTWLVVGKLQKQHQMLHTQEKILRYELAQKRKLLTELKEQLENSRENWAKAREKHSSTEQEWRQLRNEFASRKVTQSNDNCDNSLESGYSDERDCSSSDEPNYETDDSESERKTSCEESDSNADIEKNQENLTDSSLDKNKTVVPEFSRTAKEKLKGIESTDPTIQIQDTPKIDILNSNIKLNNNIHEEKVNLIVKQTNEEELNDQPSTSHNRNLKENSEELVGQRDDILNVPENDEKLVTKGSSEASGTTNTGQNYKNSFEETVLLDTASTICDSDANTVTNVKNDSNIDD